MYNNDKSENLDLDNILDEFRIAEFQVALEQEIEASQSNSSSSAIALINGKLISQIGNGHQYVFRIENAFYPPSISSDTPGDLYVTGKAPIPTHVISIEGMSITLNVLENLGKTIPNARLQSNPTFLLRKLIERIEQLADAPNPIGKLLLGETTPSGKPEILEIEGLNDNQVKAVASSIGRNLTFIWGPPGTGKSRTIGSIGKQLYNRGRSVLLVSHMNKAVDQALLYIANATNAEDMASGRIIRVGEPQKDEVKHRFAEVLLDTHVNRQNIELTERRNSLMIELENFSEEVKTLNRTLDICEWVLNAPKDIDEMSKWLSDIQKTESDLEQARDELKELETKAKQSKIARKEAEEAKFLLSKIRNIDKKLSKINQHISSIQENLKKAENKLEEEKEKYSETTSTGWLTRRWRGLPSPDEQIKVVDNLSLDVEAIKEALSDAETDKIKKEVLRSELHYKIDIFNKRYSKEPDEIIFEADIILKRLPTVKSTIKKLIKKAGTKRNELEQLLRSRVGSLREYGLTNSVVLSAEKMLESIREAYSNALLKVKDISVEEVRHERNKINSLIVSTGVEVQKIEEYLKKIEEMIIANASIVATTLTKAYLSDSIQNRKFDTVILDEASMAPIPALWVASSLANNSAVVVGDQKQLPPIVQSEHKLAKKWLGQNIFEAADFDLVKLTKQYRMHPDICMISNSLIYDGLLTNGDGLYSDEIIQEWYSFDWGHDHPVLLVDTSSLGAWVTSVHRGGRTSRLNFLSATISTDIAEQLLRKERSAWRLGDSPRIIIISPYRPHAQLLHLLLKEQGLAGEVEAGTAHSFQGSEADIVILDLVNGEPHWRANMFIPEFSEDMKKLFNVSLTRARRRLVVVGDFNYILKHGKKSFVGSELIPFLHNNYKSVEAIQVVPCGLAAREAKNQIRALGGNLEPNTARMVVTQADFYPVFFSDLERAKNIVVIYSPFMALDRIGRIEPQIRAALERGVKIYVITKTQEERKKREVANYRKIEEILTRWGVIIIHKRNMHEKVIFIDEDILWSGSLNVLSFSNTEEVMERRVSEYVAEDYAKTLHKEDLIEPYTGDLHICPICEGEMIASEGKDYPFYWRCIEDGCYSRSLDQPQIQNGIIVCSNCGGDVEIGEWGGKAAWRCVDNRYHHQKVVRNHLRLPGMRKTIPSKKLKELDIHFNISHHDLENEDD